MGAMTAKFEALRGALLAGKYRLDEIIGRGGFSAVYRGEHLAMGRAVAIKVLDVHESTAQDSSAVARFSQEARVISQLECSNTITVFDYGAEGDVFYLVMEHVDGRSLKQLLSASEAPFSEERAVHIILQILASLEEAHHYGVLHRDLKPANIMLTRNYRGEEVVKVVDFGIAKVIQESQHDPEGNPESLTRENSFVGTPRYSAPEQLFAQRLSPSTDLYGVGMILWDMLMGEPALPFTSWFECSTFHVEQRDTPIQVPAAANISPALRLILERALHRHVPQRYQSAVEMREALQAWQAGEPGEPGAIYAWPAQEPTLTLDDEDSLVLVGDGEVFDPNVDGGSFFFGEASQGTSDDFGVQPPPVRRREPGRRTGMPESFLGVELDEDAMPSPPSPASRQEVAHTPRADAATSSQGRPARAPQPRPGAQRSLLLPFLGGCGLALLALLAGVGLFWARVHKEEDAAQPEGVLQAVLQAQEEEEAEREVEERRFKTNYSREGIILAMKAAGWKKGMVSQETQLQSFSQQAIFFHNDGKECDALFIKAISAEMLQDLKRAVRPPSRFVLFDTHAVKLTPRDQKSREAVRDLERLLNRYKAMVDEQRAVPEDEPPNE